MDWQKALPEADLPSGARKTIKLGEQEILLIHHCDKVYATEPNCPHWGLPLQAGRLTEDCALICPWHRSGFDLETGDVKAWAPWPPGLGLVLGATTRQKVLTTFSVKVEDGTIYVNTGKAASSAPEPKPEVKSNNKPVDRSV